MGRFLIAGIGVLLVTLFGVLFSFSPDGLSLLILGIMALIVMLGFCFGMIPLAQYVLGFRSGRSSIQRATEIQASSTWLSVQQLDRFFFQRRLDGFFEEYKNRVEIQSKEGRVVSDLEELINEDSLALRSWQNLVNMIPNTMTSLGLLGTFLGLITGIGSIGFSSVEAVLSSIETLLAGIRTAFYTSIAGVILSLAFGTAYKLMWNLMVREMSLFMEQFHLFVMPSVEEQERKWQYEYHTQVLEKLDRIPRDQGFSLSNSAQPVQNPINEQRLMQEVRDGLQNGEFIFYIQPRCNLVNRKVIGGEALLRWNSKSMGIMPTASFLPTVESNGYIVKLDRYIWEEVCKTIRRWIDAGIRPVPISVNISKTDIIVMDVAAFFMDMVRKYRIPPRSLEIEITQNAYIQHEASTHEVAMQLRQAGFRVVVDGYNGDLMVMHTLKKAEADAMKLDLRYLGSGKESQTINAVFEQSRKLKLDIMAEGIENAEQYMTLRRGGCEEGQGFYMYKPVPVTEFESIMEADRD